MPNDVEFYLGNRKVALSEIPGRLRSKFDSWPLDTRFVLIRSAGSVRFETLNLITDKVREGGVPCFEFLLDNHKWRTLK